MKKIVLSALVAAAAVSVGFGAPDSDIGIGEHFELGTIPCKDIAKADCIQRNGCNQKTEASDEQNSCMKSCEEIAESACKR